MQNKLLVVLLLFSVKTACSQSISGKIIDPDGTPVIAAVVVLQNADSVFQTATTTDTSGCFRFESNVSPYILVVRHLLYEQKTLTDSKSDLGVIVLSTQINELNEVVIKETRPIMKVSEEGAMQFNAKTLAENKPVSSAIDLLDEIPLVQRNGDEYQVLGTMAEASIILNGRRTNLSSAQLLAMLENMPADQVKNIDVFYETPPKYGVKGPSISVVLDKKRSNEVMLRGDVFGRLRQRYYLSGGGGANLSISGKKWSFYSAYSIMKIKNRSENELDVSHQLFDSVYRISQSATTIGNGLSHSITALFEMDFDNESMLEIQYSGDIYSHDSKSNSDLYIDTLAIKTDIATIDPDNTHSLSLEYNNDDLCIGGSFLYYDAKNDQDMVSYANSVDKTGSTQKVRSLDVYVDNANDVFNGELSYGVDVNYTKTQNTYNEVVGGLQSSSKSDQNDMELSAYVGWRQKLEKGSFDLTCGLLYAKSNMNNGGEDVDLWSNVVATPSLSYIYKISGQKVLNFSLTADRVYPSYWHTIDSKTYQNKYMSIDGNPTLKPYTSYSLNAKYVLKGKYVMGAFCDYNPDFFTQLLYIQPDTLKAFYKHYNFDYRYTIGLMGVLPISWNSRISSKFTAIGMFTGDKGNYEDVHFDRNKLCGRFMMSNDFVLNKSKSLTGQISGWFQPPAIQGIYNIKAMYSLSARLVWIPNNCWNLNLSCNDLFYNKMRFSASQSIQNYKSNIWLDRQTVQLTVRYTFNDFKSKDFKDVDTSRLGVQ